MKPLFRHASRPILAKAIVNTTSVRSFENSIQRTPLMCFTRGYRAVNTIVPRSFLVTNSGDRHRRASVRRFWSSRICLDDDKLSRDISQPFGQSPAQPAPPEHPTNRVNETNPIAPQQQISEKARKSLLESLTRDVVASESSLTQLQQQAISISHDKLQKAREGSLESENIAHEIKRVPDEQLPSHRERQRWGLSKRFSVAMDDLLPKLAVVSHKVNTYTGTDYSGIEALRGEIQEQEQLVKTRRSAIDSAKQILDNALSHRASSQKEVVALLERKHSWSATDLERYMALIRSEHVNDQGVREGKEAVLQAENALEEARGQLEKRERALYHEEQIWSDTIRRNSTWVTFGLMGVNILLLLVSLLVFEPWRRSRIVREIKEALETQRLLSEAASSNVASSAQTNFPRPHDLAMIEEEIDRIYEPGERDVNMSPVEAEPRSSVPADATRAKDTEYDEIMVEREVAGQGLQGWQRFAVIAQDIVSDRVISIRRVDYTTAVLQGAAAGAVITTALLAAMRTS